MRIGRYLDHAVLKPEFTQEEAKAGIQMGIDYHAKTVCVRPCDIELAKKMCEGTDTQVSCVLDFPHGAAGVEAKAALAELYAKTGVVEIDMVMNFGLAKSGEWGRVAEEIKAVTDCAHPYGVGVKVIFETSQLTQDEIRKATEVCIECGADFVKTSTGFLGGGATKESVKTMLETAAGRIKVKPSGGMGDYETAKAFVDMGADRLGVGVAFTPAICEGEKLALGGED